MVIFGRMSALLLAMTTPLKTFETLEAQVGFPLTP